LPVGRGPQNVLLLTLYNRTDSTDEDDRSMELIQSTSLGNALTDDMGRGADDRLWRILARRVYICTGQLSTTPTSLA